MESGVSWSGHERNVAWLNACDGTFVEASSVVGFDQVEDGRVVCKTDWDRDGDVDLWLRSRNGPTLRYLENQANPEAFVEVAGLGRRTTLGIGLQSSAGGPPAETIDRVVAVPVTDGYLSASSRRVTLALGPGETLVNVGGESVAKGAAGGRRFTFEGGSLKEVGGLDAPERVPVDVAAQVASVAGGALGESALPARTVLRSSLPLPPARLEALGVPQSQEPTRPAARLLVVRSSECPTCEAVLPAALRALEAKRAAKAPRTASPNPSVDVIEVPVSMDMTSADTAQAKALEVIRITLESTLGPRAGTDLALPLSILIDGSGAAQVVYQGDLQADVVSQDATDFALDPVKAAFRPGWGRPGEGSRWFHGAPRSYESLRRALRAEGLDSDEHFYAAIASRNR